MTKSLLTVFLLAFSFCVKAQLWTPIGPNDTNRPAYGVPYNGLYFGMPAQDISASLAIDNGVPYVVSREYGSNGPVVRRLINSKWEAISSGSIIDHGGSYSKILFNKNVLYLLSSEVFYNGSATLKKLNGSTWETVGTQGFTPQGTEALSLVFMNDVPYVAYIDNTNSNKISVKKLNGNTWEQVGTAGFSTSGAKDCQIVTDGTSLYVLYTYKGTEYTTKIKVQKYSGSVWEDVGSDQISEDGYAPSIIVADQNILYVAYSYEIETGDQAVDPENYSYLRKVAVKKFNGTYWESVADVTSGEAENIGISVYKGKPYVVFDDGASSWNTIVKKLENDTWTRVFENGTLLQSQNLGYKLLFDPDGTPFIISSTTIPYVSKYDGQKWISLDDRPSRYDFVFRTALTSQGTPYFAHRDNTGRIGVKKFDGTNWVTLGTSSVVTDYSPASHVALKLIMSGDTPWLMYGTNSANFGAYVHKFNGTNWEKVGGNSLPYNYANSFSYDFALSGTSAYVSYSERISSSAQRLSVQRLVGTSWVQVGAAGFSKNTTSSALAVTGTTPYVAYSDFETGKGYVQRYSSSTWQYVGAAFSDASTQYVDITLKDGNPYVVYTDMDKSYVKKYNGTTWDRVGSSASDFSGLYQKFINDNGTLYISYTDKASGKACVRKFNGSEWVLYASSAISSGWAENIALSVRGNYAFMAYYSGGVFFKGTGITVLPIELLNFKAAANKNGAINLTWETSAKTTIGGVYSIERSKDGKDFQRIAWLFESASSIYSTIDDNPVPGVNYYRLVYLDNKGERKELAVSKVNINLNAKESYIFPNPVNGRTINVISGNINGTQKVGLFDSNGALLLEKQVDFNVGKASFNLPYSIVSGTYFLKISNDKALRMVIL